MAVITQTITYYDFDPVDVSMDERKVSLDRVRVTVRINENERVLEWFGHGYSPDGSVVRVGRMQYELAADTEEALLEELGIDLG